MKDTTRTQSLTLEYKFTQDEIKSLGCDLAENEFNLNNEIADKQNVVKGFNQRISDYENKINDLVHKIRDGFEHRNIECTVEMNCPIEGKKRITRTDIFESWIEDMNDDDNDLFI